MKTLQLLLISLAILASSVESSTIISKALRNFTISMYSVLYKKSGNIAYSPFSAHAALSMLYQGAENSTRTTLRSKLYLPDKELTADGYHEVIGRLNEAKDVKVVVANKNFIMEFYKVKQSYLSVVETKFFSEIQSVDFGNSPKAAGIINNWVSEKTQGKIPKLYEADAFSAVTRLVLVNTVYFKGDWQRKFLKGSTQTAKFHVDSDTGVDVQMMSQISTFSYVKDTAFGAQILDLPFRDTNFSMLLILPTKSNGIDELDKKFADVDVEVPVDKMTKTAVRVKIPKFKIEQTHGLTDTLKQLGMGIIFDKDKCNLNGITKEQVYVSDVIQKVYINVDEDGCEAAAATGITVTPTSVLLPKDEFIANRPFVYAVIEKHHGRFNMLFSGRVSNPIS